MALGTDQDCQPGRVARRNVRQIENYRVCATVEHIGQVFAQGRGRGEVETVAQADNGATAGRD